MNDIEKIKAEIERLKNEDYGDGYHDDDVATCALNEVLSFIASMDQQQPQGLDEAAELHCFNKSYTPEEIPDRINDFKAGVKWMAKQGETVEGKIIDFVDGRIDVEFDVNSKFRRGDKVIIQIRKRINE